METRRILLIGTGFCIGFGIGTIGWGLALGNDVQIGIGTLLVIIGTSGFFVLKFFKRGEQVPEDNR